MSAHTTNEINKIKKQIEIEHNHKVILIKILKADKNEKNKINSNIYCINKVNEVVWVVSAPPGSQEEDPFTYITRLEDGFIWAKRFFGKEYKINPSTGVAVLLGWNK